MYVCRFMSKGVKTLGVQSFRWAKLCHGNVASSTNECTFSFTFLINDLGRCPIWRFDKVQSLLVEFIHPGVSSVCSIPGNLFIGVAKLYNFTCHYVDEPG